jgi:Leucine-rich repeat (LRR) protein
MTRDELLRLIDQAAAEGWKELDLAGQELTELPPEISKLTQLETLILGKLDEEKRKWIGNQLTTLPSEIGALTNLTQLALSLNQLTMLPPEIGQLTHLQFLSLSYNQLSSLPPELAQLSSLKSLDLGYNQLNYFPPEIAQITNLLSLNLSSNQLSSLPPEIGQLRNLQSLNLFKNQLSSLSPEIGQLTNLCSLDISSNQLSILPSEIGQLTNLCSLDISSNQLSNLPSEIGQLTSLQSLNLSSNQLINLPPQIGQLTSLQSLNLSSNQLTTLPPEIGQLTSLKPLHLSSNELSSLPSEIGQLTSLQSLYLGSNQLSTLPPEIGQLTSLQLLILGSNPFLKDPPPEIVTKGTVAIRKYLKQQVEQGRDFVYEAKFLIVGEGGAGKTTLAKKIEDSNYRLQPEEKSTEGIEVIRWEFKLANGKFFRSNIWDFGGQEIYHATHQFFLTKRSLYAIVVDTRQDNTDLYYWLNVVQLLSEDSPVFIIKNEKQDRICQVNEAQLRGEFINLKETLSTNLKTNRGLDEIKAMIQRYIIALPHVGQPLPKKWVDVRKVIESDHRNYISLNEFCKICEYNDFKDRKDQLQLSDYLHDLGVCLHFQNDPLLKKTLILKPKWGTTAVYKALDTDEVKDNFGRFSRAQLDTIWSDSQYADMRDELLQLMMRFKLCYKIPGADNEYIAPQLLDVEQPDYDWDDTNNLLLRYHYDFMPKGIITRLIVEMHRFIEEQKLVWKNGVVLNNGFAHAEVIEYYHKGEIHIRVSGNKCRDLLTVISHEIDKINASYDRLKDKSRKLIPCNCPKCDGSQTPHFYPKGILDQFLTDRQLQIQCQQSYQMVDVRRLIDDFVFPSSERGAAGDRIPKAVEQRIVHLKTQALSWPIQTESQISRKTQQRIHLSRTLSRILRAQFNELIYALNAPREYIAGDTSAQSDRAIDLLNWVEGPGGCGLAELEMVLTNITSST